MPMSNQKELWAGYESAQKDGRTDRQKSRRINGQTEKQTNEQTE